MAPDAPDLIEALGYLRATALGLSPRGMATKLVLPSDQIMYTTVTAPGPDDDTRRSQIIAALEGRTPYAVADLVFDWSGKGPEVQVAVIARETLDQAEAFAVEHRLNPISFVAVPEDGTFQGEPWFGATAFSEQLLSPSDSVERDKKAVVIVTRSFAADKPAEPAPSAKAGVVAPAQPVDDLATKAPAAAEAVVDVVVPDAARAQDVRPDAAAAPIDLPAAPPVPAEIEEAPMALDVPQDEAVLPIGPASGATWNAAAASGPFASVLDPGISDEVAADLPSAAVVSFSSRRQPGDAAVPIGSMSTLDAAIQAAKDGVVRPIGSKSVAVGAAPALRNDDNPVSAKVSRPAMAAPVKAAAKSGAAGKALRGFGALVTSPGIAGGKQRSKVSIPSALPPLPASSAATMAPTPRPASTRPTGVFGSRPAAPVRGKPRYLGLILTAVLLLLLVMVAAWSSFSLASWQGGDPAVKAVDATPDPADTSDTVPAPSDEMLADMQDPADMTISDGATEASETDVAAAPDAAVPAAAAPEAVAVLADPAVALPTPAAVNDPAPNTEIALETADAAAQVADPQNEIFLAAMDAPPVAPDPLALPEPDARGDPLPAAQPAPPPFGTVYQFDADGLIRPTPEGITTPEGVLLIAGKPPVVPEIRPQNVIAAAAAAATALAAAPPAPDGLAATALGGVTVDPNGIEPTLTLAADPALAGKRPKTRPDGLAAVPNPKDGASLAPAADSRFASLRPRLRPEVVLAAGEQARLASAGASLTAQAETMAAQSDSAGISASAVSISRKPVARPQNFSRAVEAAVAAASRQPDPVAEPAAQPEPDQVANIAPDQPAAPEADNEPETVSAAPKIPTKASVAKQATFKNAINLAKMNLIGVYGTQSNRYALIRQANGNFKKVKVGDSIDGGKIAAITASEVRYSKRGKMVALAMPKG